MQVMKTANRKMLDSTVLFISDFVQVDEVTLLIIYKRQETLFEEYTKTLSYHIKGMDRFDFRKKLFAYIDIIPKDITNQVQEVRYIPEINTIYIK